MIKINGIESIIEAAYLEEGLVEKTGKATIEVNPYDGVDYAIGKTIILNNHKTKKETVESLLKNRNRVISRVKGYNSEVEVHPYIMRPNFHIMWNGDFLYISEQSRNDYQKILEELGLEEFNIVEGVIPKIYFPKVYGIPNEFLKDNDGNLTALGWILHQVGINQVDTFKDMDLLKTRKIKIG